MPIPGDYNNNYPTLEGIESISKRFTEKQLLLGGLALIFLFGLGMVTFSMRYHTYDLMSLWFSN